MATHPEKVDMILIYGEAQKNARVAANIYRQRYPNRYLPSYKMFARLETMLRRNEQAFSSRKGKPIRRRARSDEKVAQVLQYFENHPKNSIPNASVELNMSYSSVQRILKENRYHDYKNHYLEMLQPNHVDRRLNFLAEMAIAEEENGRIYSQILWTDESRFLSNGIPNRKNSHYWASENPHMVHPVQNQGHWGINVWCGIIGRHLIGPYFFDYTLTGERYLRFLREELPNLLEDVYPYFMGTMWLQQDGAPVHNTRAVEEYLNTNFPGRWIGTHGPIRWPPKSPDLTPLDFFLWGTLKNEVYKTPSRNIEHLKEKIRIACRNIGVDVLENVKRAIKKRFEKCLAEEGGHIENFN